MIHGGLGSALLTMMVILRIFGHAGSLSQFWPCTSVVVQNSVQGDRYSTICGRWSVYMCVDAHALG